MEAHMRRFLHRLITESQKGPPQEGVVFIKREPGHEDKPRSDDGPAPPRPWETHRDPAGALV